jgi:transaldolase
MNILQQLERLGQSIWYDNISRALCADGGLKRMVDQGLLGVTSNPTIFEKALSGSADYDPQIRDLVRSVPAITVEETVRALMISDIQMAADILRPVYDRTEGRDGYVSVEVTPSKARDAQATLEEARLLWRRIARRNLMIKIPATPEGLPAIRQAIAEGMNINVTLIFSIHRYREVAHAYCEGLQERARQGVALAQVASVASVFVSRIDTMVDEMLLAKAASAPPATAARCAELAGKAAVANTKLIYQVFKEVFLSPFFEPLRRQGAAYQRPLWGSTSTKNPNYRDLLYVEPLVGPHTVNTVPPATYEAILDHGSAALTVESDVDASRSVLAAIGDLGVDINAVTHRLEQDGVAAFMKSFDALTAGVAKKHAAATASVRS